MRIPILMTKTILNPYGYVYLTTNLVNGKMYIGQHAKSEHDYTYLGSGLDLVNAVKKYGFDNFTNQIIDWAIDKDDLDIKEIWWIGYFDAVNSELFYNRNTGGEGFKADETHPLNNPEKRDEVIQKIRKSRVGKKLSEETKHRISEAISGENNGFYGKHHTQESIDKMRKNLPDRSGENNANYGNYWSEEQKKSLSDKMKIIYKDTINPFEGKYHSDKSKEKMSQSWDYEKHFSDETKRKMSEAHKGKNNRQVPVVQLSLSGSFITRYSLTKDVAKNGFNPISVSKCCRGLKETYKGYKWMTEEAFNLLCDRKELEIEF